MKKKIAIIAAGFFVSVFPGFPADAGEHSDILIGGASATGVYHAVGGAVCRQINKSRRIHGIYCFAEITNGSIDNIDALRAGELEFGVVQSDWQSRAYHGLGRFEPYGPFKNLRSVFAAHPESFTLLARKGARIKSFADLKGKRVNVGISGSARRATMEVLMGAVGISMSDFALAAEHSGREISRELCNGTIDAAVYFIGHPNEDVDSATTLCGAVLVDVSGDAVAKFVDKSPVYRHTVIPGGLYPGNPRDIKTFGSVATVVTVAETPDAVVRAMVRAVFNNIESFRALHPAFMRLAPEEMSSAEMDAPLHPAAEKFFKEKGWR